MTTSGSGTRACEILAWDSDFFGRRLARYRRSRCLPEDAAAIAAECERQTIEGVYILVEAADTESIIALQQTPALLADVRVTFGTEIGRTVLEVAPDRDVHVRPAAGADVPALARIASVSHRDTRFYADRHFDSARCDRLYEVWIENSCAGYADAVLVAEGDAGRPAGYVTCHKSDAKTRGHIGLFAVSEEAQGRGVGKALMRAALAWFATNGVSTMSVATQLRNVRALRFYGRCGLLISRAELWFHLWPGDVRA